MIATERSFYLGVIAVLSVLLFVSRACTHSSTPGTEVVNSTVIKVVRDTVEVEKKDSTSWHHPKPSGSSLQAQGWVKLSLSNSGLDSGKHGPVGIGRDSVAVADYYNLRSYSDTNEVEGGQVVVENKVYMNRLAFQRVLTNLKQRTITEERVVTTTIKESAKGQLYVGIVGQGQQGDPLTAFGGQAIWETKKDKVWSLSVLYGKGGNVVFQAGHLFKISF